MRRRKHAIISRAENGDRDRLRREIMEDAEVNGGGGEMAANVPMNILG